MLAEERAATIDSLRTELQHAQVMACDLVRVSTLHITHPRKRKPGTFPTTDHLCGAGREHGVEGLRSRCM
jgi:hypothetical protein